jgi:ATP-binding cassette subfamily C protein CydD
MKLEFPRKWLIAFALISLIMVAFYILFGHHLSLILSDFIVGDQTLRAGHLVWMLVFFSAFVSVRALYKYLTSYVANSRMKALGDRLLRTVDDTTDKQSESFLNALFIHMEKYRPFESVFIPTIVNTMVKLVLIILVLFFVHTNAALILLVTAPFVPLYYVLVGLQTRDESYKQASRFDDMGTLFLNLVRGKDTVRNTGSGGTVSKKLEKNNEDFVSQTMKILRYAFQSSLMLEFITILGIGLVALEMGLQIIIFENITFYAAFFTLLLAPEFYNALKVLGVEFHNGQLARGHKDKINEWLEQPGQAAEYRMISKSEPQAVALRDVEIGFPGNTLVRGINMEFEPNTINAITGPSGGGKTTLLRSIVGLMPPVSGEIRLASDDIGYISDDIYFNDSTLYDYLADGAAAEEEVLGILEDLKLTGSVSRLREGINTPIINNNVPFSGGEIVRLKIARVLLKQPEIIVMDEPTEFLDAETENIILEYLEGFKAFSTIIAVVHRRRLLGISDTHHHLENKQIRRGDV